MCNVRKNVAIEPLLVSDAFQRKYILYEFCEQGVTAIKFCKMEFAANGEGYFHQLGRTLRHLQFPVAAVSREGLHAATDLDGTHGDTRIAAYRDRRNPTDLRLVRPSSVPLRGLN